MSAASRSTRPSAPAIFPMDAEKIKLLTDKDRVIAHVVTLKVEEEKPADAAAADATTPAEPEVIKKGKKEEEGEEGAEPAKGGEKAADKGDKKKYIRFGLAILRVRNGFVGGPIPSDGFVGAGLAPPGVNTSKVSAVTLFRRRKTETYAAHCWSRESRPGISVDAA